MTTVEIPDCIDADATVFIRKHNLRVLLTGMLMAATLINKSEYQQERILKDEDRLSNLTGLCAEAAAFIVENEDTRS